MILISDYVMETDKNVAATTGHLVVEVDIFIYKEENSKAEGSNPAEGKDIFFAELLCGVR